MLVLPPVGGDELQVSVGSGTGCLLHALSHPARLAAQVIKRGITEVADVVAINKADGHTKLAAARAAASFRTTLHWHRPRRRSWTPHVLTCSAHTGSGIDQLVEQLEQFRQALSSSGELHALRKEQRQRVAWAAAEEAVLEAFRSNAHVRQLRRLMLGDIASGELQPRAAADLLSLYYFEHTADP